MNKVFFPFRVWSIFQNGKLVVMHLHEECITCEEVCVVFILLGSFMNLESKRVFLLYMVDFENQVFQPLIIILKLFDVN
jgi:hypothetical protein